MLVSIFNDVIGPVMRGPSSSHCAAALRIGRLAREAQAHLRAYLACQAVRARAYWRAVPETAGALCSAPRRAPRTMMHILGAAAGL